MEERRRTIFLVDDNMSNLTMFKEMLKRRYNAVPMPSAAIMFDLLKNMAPDLILLDIEMPEMDGFEAIKLLKANPEWASIPVIFLTARWDTRDEMEGLALGAAAFIVKPCSANILFNQLEANLPAGERGSGRRPPAIEPRPAGAPPLDEPRITAWQSAAARAIAAPLKAAIRDLESMGDQGGLDAEFLKWLKEQAGSSGFARIAERLNNTTGGA